MRQFLFDPACQGHAKSRSLGLWLCVALLCFVSVIAKAQVGTAQKLTPPPVLGRDVSKLPPEVQRMRQAILSAATSGDIEALRVAIDMNELKPVFAKGPVGDPIAYLKAKSEDGNGREMLAILFNLLTTGYAITNAGTKDEMVVWPYHAVLKPSEITPAQEVELYRFLPPKRWKEMVAQGKYGYFSIGIAKDGVWHYFTAE
jgi:hypothetical protein